MSTVDDDVDVDDHDHDHARGVVTGAGGWHRGGPSTVARSGARDPRR
jgi:hypothetical protein